MVKVRRESGVTTEVPGTMRGEMSYPYGVTATFTS